MKTLIVGDVHCNWLALNTLLVRKKPGLVLQVGDLDYFPHYVTQGRGKRRRPLHPDNIEAAMPIHWCDGNHEDHHALQQIVRKHGHDAPIKVAENVFYQPRGSVLPLPDGRNVLFMGGAFSVDWKLRRADWSGELELITENDLDRVPNVEIDIVISHTAPNEFEIDLPPLPADWDPTPDPSRDVLSRILRERQPKLWYFGHFHTSATGESLGCKWTALSHNVGRDFVSWRWLED